MAKKILIALMALAIFLSTGLIVKAVGKNLTDSTEVLTCVKAAVEKRETAIQNAFDNYSTAVKSALQTRKSELLSAWDIADRNQRRVAIKNAWNKFKEAKRIAAKNFNQARLSAWKQFTIDRKNCKVLPTNEDQGIDLSF